MPKQPAIVNSTKTKKRNNQTKPIESNEKVIGLSLKTKNENEDSKEEMPETKKIKTKESEIFKIYKSFQSNLDSLKIFIDALSPVAFEKDSSQSEIIMKIVKDAVKQLKDEEKKEKNGNGQKEKISKEQVDLLIKQLKKLPKVNAAHSKLLFQSSFVLLVGYFEYLFADLLKFYYSYFPGNISDKPIQVIINELKAYDNIDEAIDYVISKEVETILFDLTFNELIDFFDKKLKIDLEREVINWDVINETRERRHIIVHNNSIINKKYLIKSSTNMLPDKDDLINGKKINVSNEYFKIAYNEVYLAGHILIFNCWKQWAKNDSERIFNELLNTTFDCLKSDLNFVTKKLALYNISLEPSTDLETDLSLRTKFNYFISLKRLGDNEAFEKELKKLNISSLSPLFKLAYYTLKEDKNKIIENVKFCKLIEDMKVEWLHDWPLFADIRKDEEFLKLLEDEFN